MIFRHDFLLPEFKGLGCANNMENTGFYEPPKGGRLSSPKIRGMDLISEEFEGLPEGVTRVDLVHLVKDAGAHVGMTPAMINLLEYYLRFTRDCDWSDGGRPIVYQSLLKTARQFGVSERQIQYLEKRLFEAGALTWNASGNHKRYGARDDRSGEIIFAYGVDLSPLAALRPLLEKKMEEKQAIDQAWYEIKRQIGWYRARIRSLVGEAAQIPALGQMAAEADHAYKGINGHIRSYMSLEDLRALLKAHRELSDRLQAAIEAQVPAEKECGLNKDLTINSSSTDDKNFVHIYSTKNPQSLKRDTSSPTDRNASEGSVAEPAVTKSQVSAGGESYKENWMAAIHEEMGRISWKQVLWACSDRFKEKFPLERAGKSLGWPDVVDAAYLMLDELKINKSAWWEACQVLGRDGAALCVMIIDQKVQDPDKAIRNPGGYLRAMTARAKKGELNLHGSIFGLLKREGEKCDA